MQHLANALNSGRVWCVVPCVICIRSKQCYLPWTSICVLIGQYGAFGFSLTAFVGFIIASIMSILDSIGDYYACARVCRVPPPPAHAVNRGIAIEGLCSAISGAVGCGHATSTYGGNIGAIGITGVRHSFLIICFMCCIIF